MSNLNSTLPLRTISHHRSQVRSFKEVLGAADTSLEVWHKQVRTTASFVKWKGSCLNPTPSKSKITSKITPKKHLLFAGSCFWVYMCRHEFGRLSESTCHLQDFAEVVRTVKERHKHQPGVLRVDLGAPIFGAAELLRRADHGTWEYRCPSASQRTNGEPTIFAYTCRSGNEELSFVFICYVMFTEG